MAEAIVAALVEGGFDAAIPALFWSAGTYSAINTAAFLVASYAYGQHEQSRLRSQAREAANAAARDRQILVRSAVAPRPIIYGRAKIGGTLAYPQSTGSLGQYLHMVVAFTGHQSDAFETVYFNDVALPAADGSGLIQSGVFAKHTSHTALESTQAGSITLAHTPSSISAVTRSDYASTGGFDLAVATQLTSPGDYTLVGNVVTFTGGAGPFYNVNYEWDEVQPKVRIKTRLGTPGQAAYADLISESGGKWTSAHVGVGHTDIYIRLEYDTDVFGQSSAPNPTVVLRGKKLYDPRKDSTVSGGSGSHRKNDSTTWEWTSNAALCVRDYLTDQIGCIAAEVPDAEIITAANICDEDVTLYNTGTATVVNGSPNVVGVGGTSWGPGFVGQTFIGADAVRYTIASVTDTTHLVLTANYGGSGTTAAYSIRQRRYTCNGIIGTETALLDNLRTLLGAMAGSAVWVQGRWLVRAGAYITPTVTLTENDVADGAISITPRASVRNVFNRVAGSFFDPTQLFAEVPFATVSNATYKTADGGVERSRADLQLPMCDGNVRAQRMAKIALERARSAGTILLKFNHHAYNFAPTDTVSLSLARYGYTPKVFEIRSRKYDGFTVEYGMQELASTVFDWAFGEATVYSAAAATSLPNPFATPSVLTSVTVLSGATYAKFLSDGTIIPRAFVQWTQSTDVFVRQGGRIEIEFKLDNVADYQRMPPVAGDSVSAYVEPLAANRITLIRVRAVNAVGRVGPWATVAHTPTPITGVNSQSGVTLLTKGTGMVVNGNTIVKGSGTAAWNAGVFSKNSLTGGCIATCIAPDATGQWMFGLSIDPSAGSSYTTIDYALYHATSTLEIYELSTQKASGLTFNAGDLLEVEYNGACVEYRRNGTSLRIVAAPLGLTLSFDSSFNTLLSEARAVSFLPVTPVPAQYSVSTFGSSAVSPPVAVELRNIESDTVVDTVGRSYSLSAISIATGLLVYTHVYDVYGNAAEATNLATDLDIFADGVSWGPTIVVVRSYDEPSNNRLLGGLPDAMYRNGASRQVFGSPNFKSRSAYILVGINGCGHGNGFEAYAGSIDSDPNAWVQMAFQITQEGKLIGGQTAVWDPTGATTTGHIVPGAAARVQSSEPANGNITWPVGSFPGAATQQTVGTLSFLNDTGRSADIEISVSLEVSGSGNGGTALVNSDCRIQWHKTNAGTSGSKNFPLTGSGNTYSTAAYSSHQQLNNGDTLTLTLVGGQFDYVNGASPQGSFYWRNTSMRLTAVLA